MKEKIEITFTDANGGKFNTSREVSPKDHNDHVWDKAYELIVETVRHRTGLKDPKKQ